MNYINCKVFHLLNLSTNFKIKIDCLISFSIDVHKNKYANQDIYSICNQNEHFFCRYHSALKQQYGHYSFFVIYRGLTQ